MKSKFKVAVIVVFVGTIALAVFGMLVGPTEPKTEATGIDQKASKSTEVGKDQVVEKAVVKKLDEQVYADAAKASEDYTNVIRPLVEPDNKLYRWCGILERADKDEAFSSYLIAMGDRKTRFLAFAGKEARTMKAFSGELRIGGSICIAGSYSGNHELGGKSVPILAAVIIYT